MSGAAATYLHVRARAEHDQLWHVWQVAENGTASLVASIASYDEARNRVRRHRHAGLRVDEAAWQQMAAAGVAPKDVPSDVTIV